MASDMDGPAKGLLGAFAALILGSGIASLVYGVLLLLRFIAIPYNYGIFSLYATSIALIVVGGLLILTVLLGIFGSFKDVATLRMVTMILAFVAFVTLAVIGVWAMVIFQTGRLQTSIDMDIKRLNEKYKDAPQALKDKADYLNKHYNCCGSYAELSQYTNADNEGLPDSCCIVPGTGCGKSPMTNSGKYFEKGCANIYYTTKSKTVYQLAILTLAAAGAVLIGLILYGVILHRARAGYAEVSRSA